MQAQEVSLAVSTTWCRRRLLCAGSSALRRRLLQQVQRNESRATVQHRANELATKRCFHAHLAGRRRSLRLASSPRAERRGKLARQQIEDDPGTSPVRTRFSPWPTTRVERTDRGREREGERRRSALARAILARSLDDRAALLPHEHLLLHRAPLCAASRPSQALSLALVELAPTSSPRAPLGVTVRRAASLRRASATVTDSCTWHRLLGHRTTRTSSAARPLVPAPRRLEVSRPFPLRRRLRASRRTSSRQ